MARKLTEATVTTIINYIKDNIQGALTDVRNDALDNTVTTEPPRSYFNSPKSKGYKTPAVFVIAEEFDFRVSETGANYINGLVHLNVSVLLEDRNSDSLTVRCWRYQAALHQLLAQAELVNDDNTLKLIVVVKKGRFSPLYSATKNSDSVEAAFRKEVLFECEIEHYEKL